MINIVAIGKLNDIYSKACNEYIKRLRSYTKLNIIELSEYRLCGDSPKDIDKTINNEGADIIKHLKGMVIALDSSGEQLVSEQLSELISSKQSLGVSDITFVIGGSYGLSEQVKTRADKLISFGRFTYPHQLVRVMLIEQIYRAYSIIMGSKYHK